jgi:PLP-dependent transaminase
VACALGLARLDVIEREGLVDKAALIDDWLRSGLAPARDLPTVGDVRVEGSLAALELVTDRVTTQPMGRSAVERTAFEIRRAHGVIARPYGHNLVLCPPLIITEQQARRAVNAVLDVVPRLDTDGTIAPG